MILTKSPILAYEAAGSTPWSASVLRFLRRFAPLSPATPISPPSGPATGSFNGFHRESDFLAIMRCRRLCLWVPAVTVSLALVSGVALAEDVKQYASTKPAASSDGGWMARYNSFNERIKKGNVGMLLIGDSITHGWEGAGAEVWKKFYEKRNAVNLGIGGEQTSHVLWRLDHGNADGIQPKLAVLMIGTNNAGSGQSPDEIFAGVEAVVAKLRAKLPQTKVLVLAIFPRGEKPQDHLREVNSKANEKIAKLADDKDVFFLDIGPKFLQADGTLTREIMPDLLHLSPKGYTIWAESIEPTVKKLMGEQ